MKTFRSLELAIEFYEQVSTLKITGNLRDQLHRASSSIALNLSEGNAKSSAKDKRHFFQTAYASLRECQTIFRLLKVENKNVLEVSDKLGGHLFRLVNSEIKSSPNWRKS